MLSSGLRRRVSQTLCDPHMEKSHKVVGEAAEAGSCLAVGEGRLVVLRTTFFQAHQVKLKPHSLTYCLFFLREGK